MAIKTITVRAMPTGPIVDEPTAAEILTPGMLLEGAGGTTVQKHATAGGRACAAFALEDTYQGHDIDVNYAAGDLVQMGTFRPGDRVLALLNDGECAVAGTSLLESAGNGYLRVVDPDASDYVQGDHWILAVSMDALDLSGSSGADPASRRINIQLI